MDVRARAYVEGFMAKCAENGIDPEALVKHAQLRLSGLAGAAPAASLGIAGGRAIAPKPVAPVGQQPLAPGVGAAVNPPAVGNPSPNPGARLGARLAGGVSGLVSGGSDFRNSNLWTGGQGDPAATQAIMERAQRKRQVLPQRYAQLHGGGGAPPLSEMDRASLNYMSQPRPSFLQRLRGNY